MEDLRKDYGDICIHKEIIASELEKLEADSKVKRYLDLQKQYKKLEHMKVKLYKSIKNEEYSNCNHVLVYSRIDNDKRVGRIHKYSGCIKCGLNDGILTEKLSEMSFENKIMYDYLKEHHMYYLPGKDLRIACDLSLATNIYSKIKNAHPETDEETLIIYFKRSLAYIRKKQVSDKRKNSRAKRLSLGSDFKSWYTSDLEN